MKNQTKPTKTIALRVDADAFREIKHRAVDLDCSVSDLLIAAAKAGDPLFASLRSTRKTSDDSDS